MDLITTEGPAVLGYIALGLILGATVIAAHLGSSEVRDRRHLNRVIRHARRGCPGCTGRLAELNALEDERVKVDALDTAITILNRQQENNR